MNVLHMQSIPEVVAKDAYNMYNNEIIKDYGVVSRCRLIYKRLEFIV